MKPKSQSLFHFTKSLDNLKLILQNGFWPRYCREDIKWLGLDREFVAFPMVCFCDIPLSRIEEHVKFYGSYGIGLNKQWAELQNLTPILYVSKKHPVAETYKAITRHAMNLEGDAKAEIISNIRYQLAHAKPTVGNMVIQKKIITKEFYQESEWRYVPSINDGKGYIKEADYTDEAFLIEKDQNTFDNYRLKFAPSDVQYIFVENDNDIPVVMNFIDSHMGSYSNNDVKILMSRVTSLESIKKDI